MHRLFIFLVPVLLFSCAGRYIIPLRQESLSGGTIENSAGFQQFLDGSTEGPLIPGLDLGFVPQGMAYWADEDLMIISNYSSDGSAGSLSVINMEDNQLQMILYLYNADETPHSGHLGGLAVSREYLWIASGPGVFFVSLETIRTAADGEKMLLSELIKTETKASFATFNDGILWIGEFTRANGSYPAVKAHHISARDGTLHRGWLGGYRLNPDTDMISREANSSAGIVPDYILSIPDEIQGAVFFGDKILLSASYGRTNFSRLLLFNNPLAEVAHSRYEYITGTDVPVWFLDGENLIEETAAPPMSEAVTVYDDGIAVLFESAAEKYRKTTSYPLERLQFIRIGSGPLFSP